jgi:hypothetical protein
VEKADSERRGIRRVDKTEGVSWYVEVKYGEFQEAQPCRIARLGNLEG